MTLADILEVCKAYDALGWAVQKQLDDLTEFDEFDQNPNAIKMIARFADTLSILSKEAAQELHGYVAEYQEAKEQEEAEAD